MLTASILAKKSDVPVHTVRHYTKIELLKPSRHSQNGYRVYRRSDETRLRFIKAAKDLGFSLTEIKQILDESENGNSPCPLVRELIGFNIVVNAEKIKRLQHLQMKMETAQEIWKGMKDSTPDGHSVCHLIEMFAD